jgi:transcriptional regulator EpsA
MKAWNESDVDLAAVMKVLAQSNNVRNAKELLALINSEVTDLLHHEVMVCGYQVISPKGNYVQNFLQHNYPAGYAETLTSAEGQADSPLMQRWRATHEPVLFQSGRDDGDYPSHWVDKLNEFGLHNIIGHGILDTRGTFGSYFVFARLPGEVGDKENFLLKLITPHLHLALMRAVAESEKTGKIAEFGNGLLSERQIEIVRWMKEGKTNKEIARLLSITEKNAKYHVEQIFMKFGVTSRAQAVSKAMLIGLLE